MFGMKNMSMVKFLGKKGARKHQTDMNVGLVPTVASGLETFIINSGSELWLKLHYSQYLYLYY